MWFFEMFVNKTFKSHHPPTPHSHRLRLMNCAPLFFSLNEPAFETAPFSLSEEITPVISFRAIRIAPVRDEVKTLFKSGA